MVNIKAVTLLGNIRVVVARVKSLTNPDKEYEVTISISYNGKWVIRDYSCTCEDYIYRRRICKHVYLVYREVTGGKQC